MKTLYTLLAFCLLCISVTGYSQQMPKLIRITYTDAQNQTIDNNVIRYSSDPSVTLNENPTWDTRTQKCCNYMASLKGDVAFSMQTRPLSFNRDTVSLLIASTTNGSFKFTFGQYSNLTEAKEIWLLDTYLNIAHNIRNVPAYSFDITNDPATQGSNRFKMVFVAEAFTLVCPGNTAAITPPGMNGAYVNFSASTSGSCGNATVNYSTQPGSFFAIGNTTVTVTASDGCGNQQTCNFNVLVQDIEPPVLQSSASLYFSTNTTDCSYSFTPTAPSATDNSGLVTVTGARNDGAALSAPYPKGTTTITWTATDPSGNATSTTQTVDVVDNQPPVISGPVSVNVDGCSYTVTNSSLDLSASDNCGNVTLKNSFNNSSSLAGAVFPKGTTTINWIATDASNNTASVQQVITVTDNQAPVIAPRSLASSYAVNNTGCTYKVAGNQFDPTASDNCGPITLKNNLNNTSTLANCVLPIGAKNVVWTATDASGNSSSWTEVINVVSNISVSVADASALTSGTKPNTIYIGYSPASTLTYKATVGAGTYTYKWTVSSNLTISGANNNNTVKITASNTSNNAFVVTLTVTNSYGCTAVVTKTLQVKDVSCNGNKVEVCSSNRTSCISNGSVSSSLSNGYMLGSCADNAARGVSPAEEIIKVAALSTYPNPNKGSFMLKLDGYKAGNAEIVIIDMMGKTVVKQTVEINQQSQLVPVNLLNRAAGIYQVRITTAEGIQTAKVIVNQ